MGWDLFFFFVLSYEMVKEGWGQCYFILDHCSLYYSKCSHLTNGTK